jgi:organic hydroperoxide reductase OsmC/OhrA
MSRIRWLCAGTLALTLACSALTALAAEEEFLAQTKRLQAEKPAFVRRQQDMLAVPGIDEAKFQHIAAVAKRDCPMSKALDSVPKITLVSTLRQGAGI